ncbi:hypothetical protein EVAR_20912_1 [Eumeta japonica]|uniref:Uncharacterized protein n=1 Tax=Eumeta variegata TaxID=151549 RepID=A0A4C1UW01_EUMVA|nr:hypothetical protein EVAR_20912_1 [Eumeta japonica]
MESFKWTLTIIGFQGLMMEPEGKHRNSIMKQRILAVFGLVEIVLRCILTMNDFQGLMMQLEVVRETVVLGAEKNYISTKGFRRACQADATRACGRYDAHCVVLESTSLGMFVRIRKALPKVPCGSLDSVASTCDAPGRRDAQFGKP